MNMGRGLREVEQSPDTWGGGIRGVCNYSIRVK